MKTGLVFFAVAILVSSVFGDDEDKSLTLHKKMIARRREEHFVLMKNVAKNINFEVRFRLIQVGMDRIYEIIQKNRDVLEKEGETEKMTEAKMTIIENTCLLMDMIVNYSFDNIIYAVFKKLKNKHWYGDLKWSMEFTEKYVELLDELTTKEFYFVKENMLKIINEESLPEYPFENSIKSFIPTPEKIIEQKKKIKKKLKKGPRLIDPIKIEL